MTLCVESINLAKAISDIAHAGWDVSQPTPIIHHTLSDDCPLCTLFRAALPKQPELQAGESMRVQIRPSWDGLNEVDGNSKGWDERTVFALKRLVIEGVDRRTYANNEKVSLSGRITGILRVYCLWNSPTASSCIPHRYEFRHTGSEDALSMLRVWLRHCEFSHTKCAIGDFSSDSLDGISPLPRRVIDVGPSDGSKQPRLRITNGSAGKWIALSHCWGKVETQPPKTMRNTLQKHEQSIPLETLPRTFHDAVMVARALSIRFLWIDSLCIIQDDAAEIAEQLPRMWEIYQNASLTLLAGEATNCGDGLFFDTTTISRNALESARASGDYDILGSSMSRDRADNSIPHPVEVPFYQSGKVHGSFFISPYEEEPDLHTEKQHKSLGGIPLFQRGWVLQEWALSRRSIVFLRDGIIWSCRESCENERGTPLPLTRPNVRDWYDLVQEYTKKCLTYEADRLRAVSGLARPLAVFRNDIYFAGHWRNQFPDGLLWRLRWHKKLSKCMMHLPTWSWPRYIGPIGFQLYGKPKFNRSGLSDFETVYENIHLTGTGTLRIRGPLAWVDCVEACVIDGFNNRFKAFLKHVFRGYSSWRQISTVREPCSKELAGNPNAGLSVVRCREGNLIGWADWDLGDIPEGPLAWLPLKLEKNCIQSFQCGDRARDAFHVLFLRPVAFPEVCEDRFERVGMGIIMKVQAFDDLKMTHVEIV